MKTGARAIERIWIPNKEAVAESFGQGPQHRLRIHHHDDELITHRHPRRQRSDYQIKKQRRGNPAFPLHLFEGGNRHREDLANRLHERRKRAELRAPLPSRFKLQIRFKRSLRKSRRSQRSDRLRKIGKFRKRLPFLHRLAPGQVGQKQFPRGKALRDFFRRKLAQRLPIPGDMDSIHLPALAIQKLSVRSTPR